MLFLLFGYFNLYWGKILRGDTIEAFSNQKKGTNFMVGRLPLPAFDRRSPGKRGAVLRHLEKPAAVLRIERVLADEAPLLRKSLPIKRSLRTEAFVHQREGIQVRTLYRALFPLTPESPVNHYK